MTWRVAGHLFDSGHHVIRMGTVEAGAAFDPTGRFRYLLWRVWESSKPLIHFCGLNPSTADHEISDPTCTREVTRAHAMGFGGYVKSNIFAARSTDPKGLRGDWGPTGPVGSVTNDSAIILASRSSGKVVCCWGHHGSFGNRGLYVARMLRDFGVEMSCFGITKGGHPKHPLYLPYTAELSSFEAL